MSAATLLADLRRRDIRVWADGADLRVSAPPGTLTPELRVQLRQHKQEILQFLASGRGDQCRQERQRDHQQIPHMVGVGEKAGRESEG